MIEQALRLLGEHRSILSRQQIKTLRGLVLSGRATEAMKGLERIIARSRKESIRRSKAKILHDSEIQAEIERLDSERTALIFARAKAPEISAVNEKISQLRKEREALHNAR